MYDRFRRAIFRPGMAAVFATAAISIATRAMAAFPRSPPKTCLAGHANNAAIHWALAFFQDLPFVHLSGIGSACLAKHIQLVACDGLSGKPDEKGAQRAGRRMQRRPAGPSARRCPSSSFALKATTCARWDLRKSEYPFDASKRLKTAATAPTSAELWRCASRSNVVVPAVDSSALRAGTISTLIGAKNLQFMRASRTDFNDSPQFSAVRRKCRIHTIKIGTITSKKICIDSVSRIATLTFY